MARMPKGEPRSVPDPIEGPYQTMIRFEQSKRQRAETASGNRPAMFGPGTLLASQRSYDFSSQAGGLNPFVTIEGQTYKGVDNGRANVLVPVDDPGVPAGELAERKQGVARVQFMVDHPFGSAAYDLAMLANASTEARDNALVAGGFADTVTSGFAPFGASIRTPAKPPPGQVALPNLPRPSVEFRAANAKGQALGANATLSKQTLGTGEKALRKLFPPGWQGNGTINNEARGHLVGNQLGGLANTLDKIITQTQMGQTILK